MSNDFVVIRIVAAFERGLSHSRFIERENPFAPCSWEHEAWEMTREKYLFPPEEQSLKDQQDAEPQRSGAAL